MAHPCFLVRDRELVDAGVIVAARRAETAVEAGTEIGRAGVAREGAPGGEFQAPDPFLDADVTSGVVAWCPRRRALAVGVGGGRALALEIRPGRGRRWHCGEDLLSQQLALLFFPEQLLNGVEVKHRLRQLLAVDDEALQLGLRLHCVGAKSIEFGGVDEVVVATLPALEVVWVEGELAVMRHEAVPHGSDCVICTAELGCCLQASIVEGGAQDGGNEGPQGRAQVGVPVGALVGSPAFKDCEQGANPSRGGRLSDLWGGGGKVRGVDEVVGRCGYFIVGSPR